MKRRRWISTVGALIAAPRALAQTATPARRVALLAVSARASYAEPIQALRDGLREQGLVDGREIVLDIRTAEGRSQDLPRLATELASGQPAVIVTTGADATNAALAATAATPIVALGDLVAAGHAVSLARPGGRVTGISFLPTPLNTKRLELLAELLPRASAVLNLADPLARNGPMLAVEAAGRSRALVMHAAYARTPAEIEAAFMQARALRVAGVNVMNSPFLHSHRALAIRLAAGARLPAIYQWSESAREGGLMSYGQSLGAMFRQLSGYVARILAGARPADLPIEQPTRFEFLINLRTAKALGITIPQALLLRADEVIE
jgi:putative ABC transport system substrate-binding protein